MNPNQQEYNFIYQGGSKNNSFFSAPKNNKQNIIMIGFSLLGVVVIAIIATIIIGIFKVDNSKKLTDLATYQNELQRIMEIGAEDSKSNAIKALAQTAASTYASHKQSTISLATKKGIKITDKQLSLGKSATTEDRLESAKNSNNFDEVFQKVYEEKLTEYQSKLNTLKDNESDKNIKTAIINYLNSTSLMSINYSSNNK